MLMKINCILRLKAVHVEVCSVEGKAAGLCPRGLHSYLVKRRTRQLSQCIVTAVSAHGA